MYGICEAIRAINPTAQVSVRDRNLDQITWHADTPVIPKADIEVKMVELKAEYDAKEYQRLRKSEYKSWEEQLDILYHSIDEWRAHCKTVRDKYPKP